MTIRGIPRHMPSGQERVVSKLLSKGWTINHQDEDTVYLSRQDRYIRAMTRYCQVDATGHIDGEQ